MAANENLPPGTNLLDENSQNIASDRARRINSLHRSVDDLVQEQNRKRLQISTEISSITKQQQKMMTQLDQERTDMTAETAQGYNTVLKGLGRTINSLASGVKNITIDTSKATADAVSQYGKAIGDDISINKTNTVAMSLAKATPLFGFFAAKFMETDVFQGAARKIKDKVGNAMTEGLSKAGSGIANIFKKGKKIEGEEQDKKHASIADLEKLQQTIEANPPKLQDGGYIKEGGVVEVHSAEIVAPIDKILKQIDEAKSADISKKLNSTLSMMSENLIRLETVVVERDKRSNNILETFVDEYKRARGDNEETFQKRLLRGILELKVAMVGMTSRLTIAWQRTLLQHPTFRNMLMFTDLMKSGLLAPMQFLFGVRGGYAGDVRKATSTSNAFLRISNLLGLIYSNMMPKLDKLVLYTKTSAEAVVGEEIKGPKQYTYTIFGKIKEVLTSRKIGERPGFMDNLAEKYNLDRDAMREAGINTPMNLLNPIKILRNMGVSKQNIGGSIFEGYGKAAEESSIYKLWIKIAEKISNLNKMKEAQEEREGPHSPSMAQNIATSAKEAILNNKLVNDTKEKISGLYETTVEGIKSRLKNNKFLKSIFKTISSIKKSIISFKKAAKDRYKKSYSNEYKTQKHLAEMRKQGRQSSKKLDELNKQNKKSSWIREKMSWILLQDRKDRKGWTGILIGFASTLIRTTTGIFNKLAGMSIFLLGPFFRVFKTVLGPLGTLFKGLGSKGIKGLLTSPFGAVGKYMGGFSGAAAGGGARGVVSYMARGGLKMAGSAAGLVGGGLVAGGMGLWDAIQAIRDPEAFMGNFLIRGLAGFVGGKETGLAGSTHGALKGAAMGAAIGSVVPGIGTLIGGAIGAVAGGVLGFVGGKKISEGISKSLSTIGDLAKGMWNIAMFPFRAFKEGIKSVWVLAKFGLGNVKKWINDWMAKPGILQDSVSFVSEWVSKIVNWIMTPFKWLGKKLRGIFGDNLLKRYGNLVKEIIFTAMFPLVGLKKAYTYLKDQFVNKISSLPVIGTIFKKLIGTIKDIKEGNLANKLEQALEESSNTRKTIQATKIPIDKKAQLNNIEKELYNDIIGIDNYSDGTRRKDIVNMSGAKMATEAQAKTAGYKTLAERMATSYEKGQTQTTAAIVQNTNVLTSTNKSANQVVNHGGPGRRGIQFSSGLNAARDVTMCNIK